MWSSEFLYTIFTYDYWIIKCVKKYSKREKSLDIWFLINFEIETKSGNTIHKIRNINILWEYKTENKKFLEINLFLELLSYLYKNIPEWTANFEIFNIIEKIIYFEDISETRIILAKLKIINIFWTLNLSNSDKTVEKILKFINSNKISDILKLSWINNDIKEKLSSISNY